MAELKRKDRQKILMYLERVGKSLDKIHHSKDYDSAMKHTSRAIKNLYDLNTSLSIIFLEGEELEAFRKEMADRFHK